MSFWTLLYSFLLMPIQLMFEVVFSFAYTLTNERIGLAIVALSLAINILILPLYRRADAMQEEERLLEAKLRSGVVHIKKTFRGDERTMILRTYYRQNNYSPLYVLRGAVSLFLEIPFFIVAYRFLSGLDLMQGVAFGPISDLGAPDRLITIEGVSINVLPVLMTLINVISTIIFTKGYPVKTKVQLYVMAAFFLVFLYNSPSGLVFYWTLNNLFSLVKTIFYKLENPKKVITVVLLFAGAACAGFGVFTLFRDSSVKRLIIFAVIGVLLCAPFVISVIKKKHSFKFFKIKAKPNKKLFWSGAVFLTVLMGILIPSSTITASPQEFIIVGLSMHPIWYVVGTFLIAAGFFILWMNIFYYLFSDKVKVVIERLMLVACCVGIMDYLFFGKNLGTLSAELVFENKVSYSLGVILINSALVIAIAFGIILLIRLKPRIVMGAAVAASVAMMCMSGVNTVGIFRSVAEVDLNADYNADGDYKLSLSKEGKNVVVLMLDRAMGEYIPYIMSQSPELEKMYSGFTYYSNTMSFSGHTNLTTPSLFGGYEYTPIEMNKRADESLKDKHNEAIRVMPVLFDKEGYDVTVCDPPYAGYKETPDLSIYDSYDNIKAYLTQYSMQDALKQQTVNTRVRNLFCYSLFKSSPSCFGSILYDDGKYHMMADTLNLDSYFQPYEMLKTMPEHTAVSDNKTGSFIMIDNETTHELFPDAAAELPTTADGSEVPGASSLTVDGITLNFDNLVQEGEYQTDFVALIEVGKWLDHLREQNLFDNTRIIIVSDHGYGLRQIEELLIDDTVDRLDLNRRYGDVEFYYPLLMVKDFNSNDGFKKSDEFMTSADVPTIATSDLVENAVNPFTGKTIENSEKTAHDQYILASDKYVISENNGNQYLPGRWYTVHDSIWEKSNWKLVEEFGVLPKSKE